MTISPKMIDAVKVQFLKPIFEEDFPDKGMKAWLTDIEWDRSSECYKLYFDFTDFEAENLKYFKADYYDKDRKPTLTAIELGIYHPKYSVYWSISHSEPDDEVFEKEIVEYLREVE